MIYLLLAIASSALTSVCMRLSGKYIKNEMGMFMANYAVCILLSALFMNWRSGLFGSTVEITWGLGVISGILYLIGFLFLKLNMKHNGMVLASTFMKLGVLIPTMMAVLVFHETPKWTQILGIIIAVLAIVMIHFEKDSLQEGNKKIWLLVLLVVSGITDSMANIFEKAGDAGGKDGYLLVTFLTAFFLAAVLTVRTKKKVGREEVLFGMLIGIPNYFSARFLLLSLGDLAAVIVYPTYSVATMVVIMLAGVLAFHESVSRKKACALGMIILALVLLNI